MTFYNYQGSSVRLQNSKDVNIKQELMPANYIVQQHAMTGEYYLDLADPFTLPPKMYGDVDTLAARIMTTFDDREAATGVLLDGEKGSGKTMLTRPLPLSCS